jgi:DNA-binding MarR family transcriptional regulator/GNAT superfamily N-acetyltransferase
MEQQLIDGVRHFNRTVTQRVGALDDHYLGRARPLGADRLLFEIGPSGCAVRRLRARLDLDSGYLSRLLRGLEDEGLVTIENDTADRRVRVARLTPNGEAERTLLDQRSDDLAASLLEPLRPAERTELLSAMRDVERLLTASAVEIEPIDPLHPDAQYCLNACFAELDQRFDTGFDPAQSISADADELRVPNGVLLIARLHSEPVGCGALKFHDREPTEIKRMWVDAQARGLRVGRRLLEALEARAAENGARVVRLETNRSLVEAIALYRRAGYVEVDPFNEEPYAHHWFEKRLTA